jgi:hypothetical protein
MNEPQSRRGIGRSIIALLAGMVAGILLSLGTDVVLHAVHVFPPWGASMVGYDKDLLLATIYRNIYGVLGSHIAARLAPNHPMLHAMVLGILGFVVCILGALATWNKGPTFGPHWYLWLSLFSLSQSPGSAANSASCRQIILWPRDRTSHNFTRCAKNKKPKIGDVPM